MQRTPKYRRQRRPRGDLAFVELDGRRIYLGPYDAAESKAAYHRKVAEWTANGGHLAAFQPSDIALAELMAGYIDYCERRYNGRPNGFKNVSKVRVALKPVKKFYAGTPAMSFGPRALATVRDQYVQLGWSRKVVNERVQIVKAMFKWAAREELVPASVWQGLQAIEGLRAGETTAREPRKVLPVPDSHVDAVKPYVSRQVWALIELQRLTGARPGELVIMRGRDIDMTGGTWLYRPEQHKTAHHGHERVIELGPRAQRVIEPFLKTDTDACLFSPAEAEAERRVDLRKNRKTKLWPSHVARYERKRKRKPQRRPGDHYEVPAYRRAIQRACDLADAAARAKLSDVERAKIGDRRLVPRWHPHQLRHNFGTAVRKQYGLEIARILLGHRSAVVTELYSEFDRAKTREIMARIG